MSDLTWAELDLLGDTDTIALRDRAWGEIEQLRQRVRDLMRERDAIDFDRDELRTEHGRAIRELRALRDLEDAAAEVRISGAAQHLDAPLANVWAARKPTGGAR